MERLEHAQNIKGALAAITASIVGVIGSLALWFAVHLLFGQSAMVSWGPLNLSLPVLTSLDWRAALLGTFAAVLIFRLDWSVIRTLPLAALGGLLLSLVTL
jgi:chromate transporter